MLARRSAEGVVCSQPVRPIVGAIDRHPGADRWNVVGVLVPDRHLGYEERRLADSVIMTVGV